MIDHFVWAEKYRPHCVSDCILPPSLKSIFQGYVDQKNIPNLILSGGPGTGKTTVAKAMCEELDCSYMVIDGTRDGDIATIRTKVEPYASSISWKEGRKYVIFDEADYLTHKTQPALRNLMEEFASNCGFILTCNYVSKIIEPLQSRCPPIHFVFKKEDKVKMAMQFYKSVEKMLQTEGVEYDSKVLAALISKYFPDFRRVINELQKYASRGKIDVGILSDFTASFKELCGFMKEKNFTSVRKWVADHIDSEPAHMFRQFYDGASYYFTPKFLPELVLIIAEYSHKAVMCLDQEINMTAFFVEVMLRAEWI